MVLDKIGDTVTPRYLVYDIVRLAGRDVREEPFFPNRLDYIKNDVIGVREWTESSVYYVFIFYKLFAPRSKDPCHEARHY